MVNELQNILVNKKWWANHLKGAECKTIKSDFMSEFYHDFFSKQQATYNCLPY